MSDLHLEFYEKHNNLCFRPCGDILVLAGDICCCGLDRDFDKLINFISIVSKLYVHVIAVSGNHENYSLGPVVWPIDSINARLKKLEKAIKNYHFLNCNMITLRVRDRPITFLGATLWTRISEKNKKLVTSYMNDYRHIYITNDTKFNVDHMMNLNKRHTTFIKSAITRLKTLKITHPVVLITHHKPLSQATLNGEAPCNLYKTDFLSEAYECNITKFIENSPIKLAIHGHTHRHFDQTINGVRYVSNPKGYANERIKFNPALCIEL